MRERSTSAIFLPSPTGWRGRGGETEILDPCGGRSCLMSSLGFLNGKDREKGRDEGEVHSTWLMHQHLSIFPGRLTFLFCEPCTSLRGGGSNYQCRNLRGKESISFCVWLRRGKEHEKVTCSGTTKWEETLFVYITKA